MAERNVEERSRKKREVGDKRGEENRRGGNGRREIQSVEIERGQVMK